MNSIQEAIKAYKSGLPFRVDQAHTDPEPRVVDYGNCAPGCPICHGLGFIGNDITDIHDPRFGKMRICPNKPVNLSHTGVPESEWGFSWETLVQTQAITQMRKALCAAIEAGHGLIYLYGSYGIGKTVCLKAATILAARTGIQALYTRHSNLINHLRSSYDSDKGQLEYEYRMRHLSEIQFLAIDEYGRSRQTEFGTNAFSDLLDARYEGNVAEQAITVIASNYAPEDSLEQYQEDRIRDGRSLILELPGSSMREKMTPQSTITV